MSESGREQKELRAAVTAKPQAPVVSTHATLSKMLEKTLPCSSRARRGAARLSRGARSCCCKRRRPASVLMGSSPATGVVMKLAPPSVVDWTLVMTTLDPRTLAACATVSRTVTAMPGADPALARTLAPLTGSWYVTDVVEM